MRLSSSAPAPLAGVQKVEGLTLYDAATEQLHELGVLADVLVHAEASDAQPPQPPAA